MQVRMIGGGGRREIQVVCPDCNHLRRYRRRRFSATTSSVVVAARCWIYPQVFRQLATGETGPAPSRDRADSRYKSARKGRR